MGDYKYKAFISYSHKDEKWANWLHKALETYRPPKRLVGQETERGPVPKRLAPVFRDREELPSATDLGKVIDEALKASAAQVVICSPHAARSHWVNEEILAYKRLGGENRIFCLIVDGEPNASLQADSADEECFPEALRYRLGSDGQLSVEPTEPIAADARPGKDGKPNAKIKLIAGMLGVGFDDLRQREQQRRQRRMAVVAVAATLGMVITTTLATVALFARAEADRQRVRAEEEAETARQTTNFLVDLFRVSDPSEALGNTITAREILDKGAERIGTELEGQPAIQATLMDTMGTVYKSLGLYPEARALVERGLLKRESVLGEGHIEVARSRANLGEVLALQAEYEAAADKYREAIETQRALLGPDSTEMAANLKGLADALHWQGDLAGAESRLREALDIQRRMLGNEHNDVARTLDLLGSVLFKQGEYVTAEPLMRKSVAMRRSIYKDGVHPELAEGLMNLAVVLRYTGEFEEAEALDREALEMNRTVFGDVHPTVAFSLNNLAFVLHDKGDYAAAEAMYRELITMREQLLGSGHPDVADALNNLAFVLHDIGRFDEALAMSRRSLEMYEAVFAGDHPSLAIAYGNLGGLLLDQGDYTGAEPYLRKGVAMDQRLLGDDHPDVAIGLSAIALLQLETARIEEARATASTARGILSENLTNDHWRTAWAGSIEGAALARLGHYPEAEQLLLGSDPVLRNGGGARAMHIEKTLGYLVELYRQWGKAAQADKYLAQLGKASREL